MKNFIKSKLTLIILLAIGIVFTAIASIFSVGQTVPASSYKTGEFENRKYYTAMAYQVVIPENVMLHSIWVNLGGTDKTATEKDGQVEYPETVEIFVGRSKKTSDDFGYRTDASEDKVNAAFRVANTDEGVKAGEWQKIYNYNTPTDYTYYIIATPNAIEINELAFVGVEKDGTDGGYKGDKVLLTATALGCGMKGIKGSTSEAWYKSLEHSTNILDKTETGIANANKLIDEQTAFKPEYVVEDTVNNTLTYTKNLFTNKDLVVAKSVNSIYSATAENVDSSENPVGLILVSLATLVFGTTTFTLRLVPIVFAIGSIILAYFIAKKFIKNKYVCTGVSGAVAVINLILIITSAFTWPIGIFFVLTSVYFVLGYVLSKKLKSNDFIANLSMGGLFYALSLGVKSMLIFVAPVIFVAIGYTVYARYKKALSKIKDGNTRVSTLNMIREIACAVIGFVVIPMIVLSISFLVIAPALSNVYGVDGLLQVASKHFFGAF
ncbi:MAG: phospholipid carrier-dependent glycosyltransferase [Clostridia bacterium]|nr:phospholipid carrier-dependent glycosyltransferase [Clostridia bacterium]